MQRDFKQRLRAHGVLGYFTIEQPYFKLYELTHAVYSTLVSLDRARGKWRTHHELRRELLRDEILHQREDGVYVTVPHFLLYCVPRLQITDEFEQWETRMTTLDIGTLKQQYPITRYQKEELHPEAEEFNAETVRKEATNTRLLYELLHQELIRRDVVRRVDVGGKVDYYNTLDLIKIAAPLKPKDATDRLHTLREEGRIVELEKHISLGSKSNFIKESCIDIVFPRLLYQKRLDPSSRRFCRSD